MPKPVSFDSIFGEGTSPEPDVDPDMPELPLWAAKVLKAISKELARELGPALREIGDITGDSPQDVFRRSIGAYLSIARVVKAGGSVWFIDREGKERKLKVPLK